MDLTSEKEVFKRISFLINLIRYYDYVYYVENKSLISDLEYDLLREELEKLELNYPNFIREDSPTQTVGFLNKIENFIRKKHNTPMLSLKNSYFLEDILKVIEKDNLWPVIVEPKIDGVSLSLVYEGGYLAQGLLRGDGKEGEDIFSKIIHIKTIPFKLNKKIDCEIRGELFLKKQDFLEVNEYRKKRGEYAFQNSRNGTSGLIRYKGKDVNIYKYISFIPYVILNGSDFMFDSQEESLLFLSEMKFESQTYELVFKEEELKSLIESVSSKVFSIYDMDGVVIKVNDLRKMASLGVTGHHPNGAIAYKFTNQGKECVIKNIIWQVSRNGKLTPVGNIDPIVLEGAKINRITLHNKKYMKELGININSSLLVERVGGAVPQVKKVLKKSEELIDLKNCPSCNFLLVEDENNYICENKNCKERIRGLLEYFCKVLKIKGIGAKSIEQLEKYVKTPVELVRFFVERPTMNVGGWEKIRLNFLKEAVFFSSVQLLSSLGIEELGSQSLEKIVKFFKINEIKDLIEFLEGNYEEKILKMVIKTIGQEKINCFIKFLKINQKSIIEIVHIILKINKI